MEFLSPRLDILAKNLGSKYSTESQLFFMSICSITIFTLILEKSTLTNCYSDYDTIKVIGQGAFGVAKHKEDLNPMHCLFKYVDVSNYQMEINPASKVPKSSQTFPILRSFYCNGTLSCETYRHGLFVAFLQEDFEPTTDTERY